MAEDIERWAALGLLSTEQAAAILAHEAAAKPGDAATADRPRAPERARRVPAVAEALGYLGGMLGVIGLVLLVVRYWPDMATAGRLALSGGSAIALVLSGALADEDADPAFARLRGFLWFGSTAAAALFAGVVVDTFGFERDETVVLAVSGAVAFESGLLWWWHERPLQQAAFLGGLAAFLISVTSELASEGPVGLAVWGLGAGYLVLGERRRTPIPLLTGGMGAVFLVVGATITSADWQAFGMVFGVATALGLLAVAAVPGLGPTREDRRLVGTVGTIALMGTLPGTLGYFSGNAGMVTGLVTWALGGALVLAGDRRLVREPILVEALGGLAVIGGAALTGAQWTGFAPIFGLVTAITLVALGTLPGRVLLSLLGSAGLLVNVPWAIGWFFPGEGRAPLLIMVSGAVILSVAVLLARMGGRLRSELGSQRRDDTLPRGPASHAM